jgi:hypothetical protein
VCPVFLEVSYFPVVHHGDVVCVVCEGVTHRARWPVPK